MAPRVFSESDFAASTQNSSPVQSGGRVFSENDFIDATPTTSAPLEASFKRDFLGPIASFGNAIFPFMDELSAGGSAILEDVGTGLTNAIYGTSLKPEANYDDYLNTIREARKEFRQAAPAPAIAMDILGATKLPISSVTKPVKTWGDIGGNIAKTAGVGGGIGALYGFGDAEGSAENRLNNALNMGLLGGALSGGLQSAGEGLGMFARATGLDDVARKLTLSAFGANKTAIKRANARMPDLLDEEGVYTNPISEAIDSFRNAGGAKDSLNPESLLNDLRMQRKDLGTKLGNEISEAQAVQDDLTAAGAEYLIKPEFEMTRKYIASLAGTNKARAKQIAEEEIAATMGNMDGSISSIQSEKVKLGDAIADTAWGADSSDQLRKNILKRVRADLRKTVEDSYETLMGGSKSANVITDLNTQLGQRQTLKPLFTDMLNAGEARDPLNYLLQNWKTTGGFGGMALLGALSGAGSLASGIPILGALATTPTGRLGLANVASKLGSASTGTLPAITSAIVANELPKEKRKNQDFIDKAMDKAEAKIMDEKPKADVIIEDRETDKTLDPLFKAVVWRESSNKKFPDGNPNAISPKGATGLMQVMPDTAKYIAKKLGIEEYDLKDPETNKAFGEFYLKEQLEDFGDVGLALAAYNAGPGKVKQWLKRYNATTWDEVLEGIKSDIQEGKLSKRYYKETLDYVPAILNRMRKIQMV